MPPAANGEQGTSTPGSGVLSFESASAWERWLERHHEDTPGGVWLRLARKGASQQSVSYDEAVDVALCFGWIDGQKKRFDDVSSLQRFTPRRPRSMWSKRNTERVERLVSAGRMRPAGLREVEAAKRDGRWDRAYAPPSEARVPDDFLAELRTNSKAHAFFETLDKRNVYAVSYRIESAKKPETRARRIRAFVEMLERGERLYD